MINRLFLKSFRNIINPILFPINRVIPMNLITNQVQQFSTSQNGSHNDEDNTNHKNKNPLSHIMGQLDRAQKLNKQGNAQKSLATLQETLDFARKEKKQWVIPIMKKALRLYEQKRILDKILKYAGQLREIQKQIPLNYYKYNYLIGRSYFEMKKLKQAQPYLKQAFQLFQQNKGFDEAERKLTVYADMCGMLAIIYEDNNDLVYEYTMKIFINQEYTPVETRYSLQWTDNVAKIIIQFLHRNEIEKGKELFKIFKQIFFANEKNYPKEEGLAHVMIRFNADLRQNLEIMQEWKRRILKDSGKGINYIRILLALQSNYYNLSQFDNAQLILEEAILLNDNLSQNERFQRYLVLNIKLLLKLKSKKKQENEIEQIIQIYKQKQTSKVDDRLKIRNIILLYLQEIKDYERTIWASQQLLEAQNTLTQSLTLIVQLLGFHNMYSPKNVSNFPKHIAKAEQLLSNEQISIENRAILVLKILEYYFKVVNEQKIQHYLEKAENIYKPYFNEQSILQYKFMHVVLFSHRKEFQKALQLCKQCIEFLEGSKISEDKKSRQLEHSLIPTYMNLQAEVDKNK